MNGIEPVQCELSRNRVCTVNCQHNMMHQKTDRCKFGICAISEKVCSCIS